MKYILELEFEDVPYCKDCICSFHKFVDESRLYCKALPNRPRCPITGRLNNCPLKKLDLNWPNFLSCFFVC